MKIGTFYTVLLYALKNKEINSINEGMRELSKTGVCYYEVFADSISNKEDEATLVSALKNNDCRIGNLYFKQDLFPDSSSFVNLLDYTKKIIEQCKRIGCKKIMPVITVCEDDSKKASELIVDYYKKASEISYEQGIVTVFENHHDPRTKCFSLNDIKNLIENADKLSYLFDTGNYWFSSENKTKVMDDTKGRIGRVHLKDILPVDNSNPDDSKIKVHYATLGQGVSNIKECIKHLERNGYDKGFTIEIDYSNPILPRVRKSVEVINQAEKEMWLIMASDNYHELLLKYASDYESLGEEIELKTMHMLSVASLMNELAVKLHVNKQMHKLAIITGLFHDIGRYEQYKQYHTFRDSISVDHADLSAEIISREKLLFDLDEKEREMVLKAVRNHNKYEIESGLDEDTLLLSKMIRDADKIDCFRVVSSEPYETSYAVTRKELEDSKISKEIVESILNHRMVNNKERKYPLDYILSCCAFVFDINFSISRRIILDKNKYLCGLNELSYTDDRTADTINTIFEEIKQYLIQTD